MEWRCVATKPLFGDVASPSSPPAPKVLLDSKHKHTLFPKLIVQLGLSIFLPLMGLCIRPKGVGLQACFAQCLSMGDFKLSSQFKKFYVYMASMVKFLGDIS